MLFLQGTRDKLADLAFLRPICDRLQVHVKAELHIVDGADHGFHVPRKSGRTDEDVLEELSEVITHWSTGLARNPFF
jgi:predicted alpha/beta-hydrolase family hydrolase